jgi:hypothetical protein
MLGVAAAGLVHAAAALLLAAAVSLFGFAAIPERFLRQRPSRHHPVGGPGHHEQHRPLRARHALPASLSIGALLFGWTAWILGTFIGTWTIEPLFVLGVALALTRVRAWTRMLARAGRDLGRLLAADKLASAAAIAVALLALPQLLLPVVDSDGLRYHLALPHLFVMTGHVFTYPWDSMGALPQCSEMLYLVANRAGGETAKFLHALFFLGSLTTLATIAAAHRPTRRAAMLAPLFYAAGNVVLAPVGTAFIDHIAAFHVLTAALLLFHVRGRRESPLLAGLAIGAAAATKLTTLPVLGGLALYGLVASDRKRLSFVLPIVIAMAPFAMRAFVHTGDPIFPLGYSLLHRPIPGIAADRAQWTAYYHSSVDGPLGIAWLPSPEVQSDDVAGIHHVLGLFAIALAIRDRSLRKWLWLVVPYLATALVIHPPTRYLMTVFAGLALFEAAAVARLPRRWRAVAAILITLPAASIAGYFCLRWFEPMDYLLGRMTREQFLTARLPSYRANVAVNALPPGGTVMALDFPTTYYFNRPFIAEGILNEPPLKAWIVEAKTADDVLRHLREHHVRVLVITGGYGGGTRASLMPLAANAQQDRIVAELRRRLQLVKTIGDIDIVVVH